MPGHGWKQRVAALASLYMTNSTAAAPQPVQGNPGDIVFTSCPSGALPGAECGYAIVPLDYSNPSAGVAKIALGRYNATGPNRKGSVFVNPGGPGGPGVGLAINAGSVLQQLVTGNEYDIIGFDPRGIGQTEPTTQCFPSKEARAAFIANTVLGQGYDVGGDLSDPQNRFHLIAQQREAEALYKTQFAICGQNMGDALRYMGTTTVARDIDFIASRLDGPDSLINFYGLSYGTVIGQYLVNMFPERVGRVAIDGVVDADAWANVPPYKWYRTWLSSTENTYQSFFQDCAKVGPKGCALAKANDTAADIFNRVEAFINGLYDQPLPVPNATIPGILTTGRARYFWIGSLTNPDSWPSTAQQFAAAMAGDASEVLNTVNTPQYVDLQRSGVSCNDQKPFPAPTPEETVDELIDVYTNVTRFNFAVTISEADSGCQYWPVSPPEKFLGPWNNTLKNPVLIVSNTGDPVTPLSNAKIVEQVLGDSAALLVQDGPGHTSLALPSACTMQNLNAFFANGTLPTEGTICAVDGSAFPEPEETGGVIAATENVKSLAAQGSDLRESVRQLSSYVLGRRQ